MCGDGTRGAGDTEMQELPVRRLQNRVWEDDEETKKQRYSADLFKYLLSIYNMSRTVLTRGIQQ